MEMAGACVLSALMVGSASAQGATVITGVAVVDVVEGVVLTDRTVVIEAGRITSINDAAPDGATVIAGEGKYLIPGLWDMHVHVRHPVAPTVLFPQFVANGITGVRDMSSDCDDEGEVCLPEIREWQSRIDEGELLGPRLIQLSSFALNPPWDFELTEDRAREVVRQASERGADLMKLYYRFPPAGLAWITDEASRLGMYVGGHIPLRMTAIEASEVGLGTLEHARDFLFDCFPGSADFRASAMSQNPPMDVMRSMVDDHDEALCEDTFRTLVENGTWYVPTHVTRRMDAFADDPEFRDDERQRFLPADVWDAWQEDADGMVALDPSPEGRRVMRAFYERGLEITGRAHGAGVSVVLGTDAGDTYVFPGSGAHDELGELVKAGLTPAEALAASTIRAAEFAGRADEFGTVAVGKCADLVLLDGNPLVDIASTRRISAVILGGRVYDRAALDEMLAAVVEAIAAAEAEGDRD